MRPKMADVAQLAGVSISTVSLVLNEKPGISPQVRVAVRQAIEELGYKGRTEAATDTLLDGRESRRKISPTYTELKTKISAATPQSYGQYAKALATWRTKMTDTILLQEDTTT